MSDPMLQDKPMCPKCCKRECMQYNPCTEEWRCVLCNCVWNRLYLDGWNDGMRAKEAMAPKTTSVWSRFIWELDAKQRSMESMDRQSDDIARAFHIAMTGVVEGIKMCAIRAEATLTDQNKETT